MHYPDLCLEELGRVNLNYYTRFPAEIQRGLNQDAIRYPHRCTNPLMEEEWKVKKFRPSCA